MGRSVKLEDHHRFTIIISATAICATALGFTALTHINSTGHCLSLPVLDRQPIRGVPMPALQPNGSVK